MRISCIVNGSAVVADDVWPGESLLHVLRERMGLPGSKNACEQGECGSCSVYLDGSRVCGCLVLAWQAQGREGKTVAGLGLAGSPQPAPDEALKTRGDFPYSSDLQVEGMLWGTTARSPHPYARILSIDTAEARSMPGVLAVLTHKDVPGRNAYGLEIADQPVIADDVARYWGEAVALVAADHPEQARRAAHAVNVEYEVLEPLTDPEVALTQSAPRLHPDGNITRQVKIRRGDQNPRADVVVSGEY